VAVIVDDHILRLCLAGREPGEVARVRRRGRLYTSGLWYHRLCRGLSAARLGGVHSSRLASLPPEEAARLLATCEHLPAAVRVVSLRDLAWSMAVILREHRLNLLQLEAVAVARRVGGTICVWERDDSPPLRRAADILGVPFLAVPL
jgi:hypothetical protein